MTDFIWQSTALIGALVFVLGSCVGSFINVVAYRLPIMARADTDTSRFNLAYPPSHCTSCAQVIKPWQNLPIVGYLWLRGRSHCCNQPIASSYPLMELCTGAVSVVIFVHLTAELGPLADKPRAFLTALAGALGLFWWLIAIVTTSRQQSVSVSPLWQSLLWLGLLINLDVQYCPLPDAVGSVFITLALGQLPLRRVTQNQDRIHLFIQGITAGLAWFGSALLLPLALILLGVGIVKLAASVARHASSKTPVNLKLRGDQSIIAAAIALSWFLRV